MIVLDANWDCVECLYSAESSLPPRLLVQATDARQALRLGWKNGETCRLNSSGGIPVQRVRWVMFPGWFITMGWLVMPFLANRARNQHSRLVGVDDGTVAIVSPHYLPILRHLQPRILVYHPIDDYTEYWPARARVTLRRETIVAEKADLILCAGIKRVNEFRERFPGRVDRIHHMPNSVPEQFLVAESSVPKSGRVGRDGQRPLLGCIGSIAGRLDVDAVKRLAQEIPDAMIDVGSYKPAVDPFAGISNVMYHDSLPREQMPGLVRSFDICLLPQSRRHFNDCASPRKLYEYLGSTRPIVTLNTPEAGTLAPYVYSTGSTGEFVGTVKRLLDSGETDNYPRLRWQLARDRTASVLANRYASLLSDIGGSRK